MDPAALLDPKGARRRGNNPHLSYPSLNPRNMSDAQAVWPPGLMAMASFTGDDYVYPRGPDDAGDEQQHPYPYVFQHPLMANDVVAAPKIPSPAPQYQPQLFDPRALLNPKSVSKRPAAEQNPERGRETENGQQLPGQVSMVERLHNVHERTASPAKKIKTEDDRKKQNRSPASFGAGALDLTKQSNGQAQMSQRNLAIDLTMSKNSFNTRLSIILIS
jgi:hypothetical protein